MELLRGSELQGVLHAAPRNQLEDGLELGAEQLMRPVRRARVPMLSHACVLASRTAGELRFDVFLTHGHSIYGAPTRASWLPQEPNSPTHVAPQVAREARQPWSVPNYLAAAVRRAEVAHEAWKDVRCA